MDEVLALEQKSITKKKTNKLNSEFNSDFDTAWKTILGRFFEDFIALCLPEFYRHINWSLDYESLDAELLAMSRDAPIGKRVADKLIKVYLKNGTQTFFLIHAEIQGNKDNLMGERMFIYNYRAYDRYRVPVVSIAILIDRNHSWRPSHFKQGLLGSTMDFKFITIKLLDFNNRIEELEASSNRFAPVILAQLESMKKKPMQLRAEIKFILAKALYKRGWLKDDILALYTFLDWIFVLPKNLEIEYNQKITKLEEDNKMAYGVLSAERCGFEKGCVQGELNVLLRLMKRKFGVLPSSCESRLQQANADQLLLWGDRILEAECLEEIFDS